MRRSLHSSLVLVGLGITSLSAQAGETGKSPSAADVEFFEAKVRPILVENCLGCHGPTKQKGGLRLDSRTALLKGADTGEVVVPGDPEASALIQAVGYEGDNPMPPRGKLKPAQIEILRSWVKRGAPWPESRTVTAGGASAPVKDPKSHWAFQPVRKPTVPAVRSGSVNGPIDAFVLKRLEQKGLTPVEEADRATLLRRVTFDLIGLPPTPEEVRAFVEDQKPGAYERVVDRLLSSPRYGERWGRHWLDVARYAEDQAHTFEARRYPFGFKYRDWVVSSLNADLPYDRFVAEQIAADQLDGPDRDARLAALGFFALGPVYYGMAIADELDDRVDTLARGFLALTVACARCHDHKFDPISTKDYYSLAGIFSSTVYKEIPDAPREQVERFEKAQADIKAKTTEVDAFLAACSVRNGVKIPKNQVEKSLPPESKARLKELRDQLARMKKQAPPQYPVVHSLADADKPANLKVHIRGNPENLGEEAPRGFLSVLASDGKRTFDKGSGRLQLARAIANPENPLTARVLVNRVWEHHFGRGLVATPSNFGTLGEPPSHPDLLDYLAARLMEQGWSIKALHREILLSATYQRSSRLDSKNQEADPDNTLLWRMNRRRLEVEPWRDAMLAVSGQLRPELGGPPQDLTSPENRRRTLYASVSRHNLDALLRLFDFPDPNITCDRRVVTSVPLQQLFVLNSEFMVRQARALARRLTQGDGDDASRVRNAFALLFGRSPSEDEVKMGVEFLQASRSSASGDGLNEWEQYAQALLGSNEFTFVD
ncbi:MAG: PSD1 and planctomycete cytochrome C domain-containing protein [Isosphaeraceae bacterium]